MCVHWYRQSTGSLLWKEVLHPWDLFKGLIFLCSCQRWANCNLRRNWQAWPPNVIVEFLWIRKKGTVGSCTSKRHETNLLPSTLSVLRTQGRLYVLLPELELEIAHCGKAWSHIEEQRVGPVPWPSIPVRSQSKTAHGVMFHSLLFNLLVLWRCFLFSSLVWNPCVNIWF